MAPRHHAMQWWAVISNRTPVSWASLYKEPIQNPTSHQISQILVRLFHRVQLFELFEILSIERRRYKTSKVRQHVVWDRSMENRFWIIVVPRGFGRIWLNIRHPYPDCKDHGANTGSTWVLSVPGGPHVGPMTLTIGVAVFRKSWVLW